MKKWYELFNWCGNLYLGNMDWSGKKYFDPYLIQTLTSQWSFNDEGKFKVQTWGFSVPQIWTWKRSVANKFNYYINFSNWCKQSKRKRKCRYNIW